MQHRGILIGWKLLRNNNFLLCFALLGKGETVEKKKKIKRKEPLAEPWLAKSVKEAKSLVSVQLDIFQVRTPSGVLTYLPSCEHLAHRRGKSGIQFSNTPMLLLFFFMLLPTPTISYSIVSHVSLTSTPWTLHRLVPRRDYIISVCSLFKYVHYTRRSQKL